jgi:hypothetical protein
MKQSALNRYQIPRWGVSSRAFQTLFQHDDLLSLAPAHERSECSVRGMTMRVNIAMNRGSAFSPPHARFRLGYICCSATLSLSALPYSTPDLSSNHLPHAARNPLQETGLQNRISLLVKSLLVYSLLVHSNCSLKQPLQTSRFRCFPTFHSTFRASLLAAGTRFSCSLQQSRYRLA